MLACRENLSKSGGAMYDCSRGSSSGSARRNAGRSTSGRHPAWRVLLAGTFAILVACGSDDSADETGAGGADSVAACASSAAACSASADAGRPLPGEGLEPTPDFDITNPQRDVPSRQELVDGVATLNGAGGSAASNTSDAGTGDAGTDAGGAL